MSKNIIIIYTLENCTKCILLKNFLRDNNILFEEKNMLDIESLTELAYNNIFTNIAPILQIKNNFYTSELLFNNDSINKELILNKVI